MDFVAKDLPRNIEKSFYNILIVIEYLNNHLKIPKIIFNIFMDNNFQLPNKQACLD